MLNLTRHLSSINSLAIWHREIRACQRRFKAPSLDRLIYILFHRFSLMGSAEKSFFVHHVRPGMRVVDIGANIGMYTLLLSQLVGEHGKVFAFEPDSALYEVLSHNCRINHATNVKLFNLALGSKSETRFLFRPGLNSGDNRLAKDTHVGFSQEMEVRVSKLDDLLHEENIDFIKMDVQGWEFEVFHGMKRMIDHNQQLLIFFEFWPYGLRNSGCNPVDVLKYLEAHQLSIYEIGKEKIQRISDFDSAAKKLSGKRFANMCATREPSKMKLFTTS